VCSSDLRKENAMSNIDRYRGQSPFRDLFDNSRRLNRLFDDMFLRFPGSAMMEQGFGENPLVQSDFEELEDCFLLTFDVPGLRKEDIHIEALGNRLNIWGERRDEVGGRKAGARERRFAHFEQSLTLPSDIDADQVEAECRDGVLRIAIPKSESQKARRIAIGESKEGGLFSRLMGKVEQAVGAGSKTERKADEIPVKKTA